MEAGQRGTPRSQAVWAASAARLRAPVEPLGARVPRLVVQPLERFLRLEAGSASLLIAAALAALVWANVDGASYERFWATAVSVGGWPSTY